jgi:hypothetical protein
VCRWWRELSVSASSTAGGFSNISREDLHCAWASCGVSEIGGYSSRERVNESSWSEKRLHCRETNTGAFWSPSTGVHSGVLQPRDEASLSRCGCMRRQPRCTALKCTFGRGAGLS